MEHVSSAGWDSNVTNSVKTAISRQSTASVGTRFEINTEYNFTVPDSDTYCLALIAQTWEGVAVYYQRNLDIEGTDLATQMQRYFRVHDETEAMRWAYMDSMHVPNRPQKQRTFFFHQDLLNSNFLISLLQRVPEKTPKLIGEGYLNDVQGRVVLNPIKVEGANLAIGIRSARELH